MSIIHDALKKAQSDMGRKKEKKTPEIYNKLKEKHQAHYQEPEKEDKAQEKVLPQTQTQDKPEKKPWNFTLILLIAIFSIFIGVFISFLIVLVNQSSTKMANVEEPPQQISKPAPVQEKPPAPAPAKVETPPPAKVQTPPPSNEDELVLSGTMMMGEKRVALINGEIYELGEYVDGKKITEITLRNVLLTDEDGKKSLLDVRRKR